MMKSFIEQAQFYSQYHQSRNTLITHLIGVPLIIFSVMIFLGFILLVMPGVFTLSFATIGTILLAAYYVWLNWRLGLCLAPILLILLWISSFISHNGPTHFSFWAFVILFVAGWAVQLSGHIMEGKKPAFMDNVCQALVAPLFLVAEVAFMFGFMQDLRKEIHGEEVKAPASENV